MVSLATSSDNLLSSWKSSASDDLDDATLVEDADDHRISADHRIPMRMGPNEVFGVTLSWHNISVSVADKSPRCLDRLPVKMRKTPQPVATKKILRGVTGIVTPGTFLVIMGSSGSGKTTLLNVMTSRNVSGLDIGGEVRVNGRNIGGDINTVAGYMQQVDILPGTLTVREYLMFCAALQLDYSLTHGDRYQKVDDLLVETGLMKCADTRIGIPGFMKGISGGERRRLSFACAAMHNPSLLFCDEPTTGLDSYMAQCLVKIMKSTTNRGRSIICTIHQPSSEIFALFDEIILLAEGRVAYMGVASEIESFFDDIGYPCPRNFNPADHAVETLSVKNKDRKFTEDICDKFDASWRADAIQTELSVSCREDRFMLEMKEAETYYRDIDKNATGWRKRSAESYASPWRRQFILILWRSLIEMLRDRRIVVARVLQLLVNAVAVGIVYWQQNYDQTGVSNINSATFSIVLQLSFNTCYSVIAIFAGERPLRTREHNDKLYCTSAYYLARVTVDIPLYAILSAGYICVVYWMIGFVANSAAFFTILLAGILHTYVCIAVAHMLSAACDTLQKANGLLILLLLPMVVASGFLLSIDSIFPVLRPIASLSTFKYSYETIVVEQWRYVTEIDCEYNDVDYNVVDVAEMSSTSSDILSYNDVTTTAASNASLCYSNGQQVIDSLGFDVNDVTTNCFCVLALAVAFEILCYFFLYRSMRRK